MSKTEVIIKPEAKKNVGTEGFTITHLKKN